MIGFPLDSHVTYEQDGTPIWDRAVSSAPMRKLIKSLFSDGVLPNPSTNLQVSAGTGMNVLVSPGFATVNGCMKLEESQRTLAVQAASALYDRIDTVVVRLNDNDSERICDLYILEGTPASSPVRPALTRTESIWELGLADLFVAKNSTVVSNQRITDTRYETARCGVISSISEFDTTALYQQIQADLEAFQSEEQVEFQEWFDNIRNQLSEDAAGNLQNQIDAEKEIRSEDDRNIWRDLTRNVKEIKTTATEAILGGGSVIRPVCTSALSDGEYVEAPSDLKAFNAFTETSQLILAKGGYEVTNPYSFTSGGITYYTGTFTKIDVTTGMVLSKNTYQIKEYNAAYILFHEGAKEVTRFGTGQHVFNAFCGIVSEVPNDTLLFSVDTDLTGYLICTQINSGKSYPISVQAGKAKAAGYIPVSQYCTLTGTLC